MAACTCTWRAHGESPVVRCGSIGFMLEGSGAAGEGRGFSAAGELIFAIKAAKHLPSPPPHADCLCPFR
jgi:hypothetical protein